MFRDPTGLVDDPEVRVDGDLDGAAVVGVDLRVEEERPVLESIRSISFSRI
jgi:hypothetical protein